MALIFEFFQAPFAPRAPFFTLKLEELSTVFAPLFAPLFTPLDTPPTPSSLRRSRPPLSPPLMISRLPSPPPLLLLPLAPRSVVAGASSGRSREFVHQAEVKINELTGDKKQKAKRQRSATTREGEANRLEVEICLLRDSGLSLAFVNL